MIGRSDGGDGQLTIARAQPFTCLLRPSATTSAGWFSSSHAIFYRHRCLVCEDTMRRKTERQRFGSGHKVCKRNISVFRGFMTTLMQSRLPP
jgi:hypothetical protein